MTFFSALSVRNFRYLLIGSFGSNIGTWMQRVAQDWLVLELTSSPVALGFAAGLQFLPALLFTPFGGVLADRYPKRRIVILTQVLMALCSVMLASLAIRGAVEMWQVYILVFAFGTAAAFDLPSRTSLVGDLVDHRRLPNAVSLNSMSLHLGRLMGPAIAGGLIAVMGSGTESTGWVILVNCVSYIGVIIALLLIKTDEMIHTKREPGQLGTLMAGLRYLLSRRDLTVVLVTMFIANVAGLNFQVIIAMMATIEYGLGAGEFGIMGTVLAIGSVVGGFFAARRTQIGLAYVTIGGTIFGLVVLGSAAMPTYVWFTAYLPLCGFFSILLTTAGSTYIQLNTDSAYRGRVMAIHLSIFIGGSAIGAPVLGLVAEHFGPRYVIVIAGLLTALASAFAWGLSHNRNYALAGIQESDGKERLDARG